MFFRKTAYFCKKTLHVVLIKPLSRLPFFVANKISQWFLYRAQLNLLLKKHGITLALDVGANTGRFAENLSFFFNGTIFSFEPVAATFAQLILNSQASRNWHCYPFALGSADAEANIYVAKNSLFNSLHHHNQGAVEIFGQQSAGLTAEKIEVKRFDTFVETQKLRLAHQKIFLKMDTQGHDLEVFKGMGDYLNRVFLIQTELSLIPLYDNTPHWTEAISTIEKAGFRVVAMFPVNKLGDQVIEYDCIFEREAQSATE